MQIGWIDISKEQRNKVLSVLRLLAEPGALDELGIGTIRNAFSDIFFPGTSTIQTRAKYLFIVPYIMLELERENLKPHEFLNLLSEKELQLIDVLAKDGEQGVIGADARESLKRKPSSIYWNALRIYGFFTHESLTLAEYVRAFCSAKSSRQRIKYLGHKRSNEEDTSDDQDSAGRVLNLWRVPVPPPNWRDGLTINLTGDEALYLKEKILTMPKTRDSLLALILRENRVDFCAYEKFYDIDNLLSLMPESLRTDYLLAKDFAEFIYGAQIRYNVLFTKGQSEHVNEEWQKWRANIPPLNLDNLFVRLNVKSKSLRDFLRSFQNFVQVNDTEKIDNLIIAREKQLKGPSRSKLTNRNLYQYNGKLVNMVRLNYRFHYAKRIIADIFEGLGERNV